MSVEPPPAASRPTTGPPASPSAGRTRPLALVLGVATCLLPLVATGCAPRTGPGYSQAFDPARYRIIGVGRFTVGSAVEDSAAEARRVVTRAFTENLVRLGYDVVERQRLEEIIEEAQLQWSEMASDEGRALLERENPDALLIGDIYSYRMDEETGEPQVLIRAQLIDMENGRVLWSDRGASGVRGGGPQTSVERLVAISNQMAEEDEEEGAAGDTTWTDEMARAADAVEKGNSLPATTMNVVREMCRQLPLSGGG